MKSIGNYWQDLKGHILKGIFKRNKKELRNENPIISLAPRVLETEQELASVQPYLDRISQALATKDINNIAITGNYGSGKSTIIKTFQHLNQNKYKYLNISLASFTQIENPDADFERRLEISILQQMFYTVQPSKIPDSRFKRINAISIWYLCLFSCFVVAFALSTIMLFKFDYVYFLNPHQWSNALAINWTTVLSSLIFFFGIGLLSTSIYRLFINSKINKINIKGELEINDQHEASIFNQYLEEILYFFTKTGIEVVIIEDVDRFNSTEIFVKLRELNILINKSEEINRPVKFLYAVKDDMFEKKDERVKFFEYIIPVIPFVNASNANEQIERLIKEAGLGDSLSKDFTSDVVTFIDDIDMRLLLNVFIEYELYRNLLGKSLDQDSLFAIIVYKNLEPEDFGRLQRRDGKLFNLFASKEKSFQSLKSKLEQQINELKEEIKKNEYENSISLKELRIIYLTNYSIQLPDFEAFEVDGRKNIIQASEEKYFEMIRNNESQYYWKTERHRAQPQSAAFTVKFKDVEKAVSQRGTYSQREKAIQEWTKNRNGTLLQKIKSIENEVKLLESMSLAQLFERFRDEGILGAFKDNKLVRSLLVNGHINEHYEDFISIFHEVSLTKQDFEYERSIKSSISLPNNHPLERFDTLFKRIPIHYLGKDTALNFDLLTYLCKNIDNEFERFNAFVHGFQKMDKNRLDFIVEFIARDAQSATVFISRGAEISLDYFPILFEENGALSYEMNKVLKFHFENLSNEVFDNLDKGKYLKNHLENKQDFFGFAETLSRTAQLLEFVKRHDAKIQELDVPSERIIEVVQFIYNQSLYALNRRNIKILIDALNLIEKSDKLDTALLSSIYETELKPMIDYIDQDMDTFLNEVILTEALNTEESEETILGILDSVEVEDETKSAIIRTQHFVLDDSTQLEDAFLQQELFKFKKVAPTWKNVIHYLGLDENASTDDVLLAFLNDSKNHALLAQTPLSDFTSDEEIIERLHVMVLNSPFIDDFTFEILLNALDYEGFEFDFSALSPTRISILIQKGLVELNQENFKALEAKQDKLHIQLIEVRLEDFLENDEITLSTVNWIHLLNSRAFNQQDKNKFISKIDLELIQKSDSLTETIFKHLPTKSSISMPVAFWQRAFETSASVESKITMFLLNESTFNREECVRIISKFGEDYEKILQKRFKRPFRLNKEHISLAEFLQHKGLVSKYEIDSEKDEVRIFANY